MFGALWRYIRGLGYLLTGKVDKARERLDINPAVASAKYDGVISEKKKRLHQYKDAIAAMISQEEVKKQKVRTLKDEIDRTEKLKNGAQARAKQLVEKYNGDPIAVKADPEYLRCQTAFRDFSSTLEERGKRLNELLGDLSQLSTTIISHKNQIQSLMRELERIQEEKGATIAELISAKEEKEIADMMSGLSEDRSSTELSELRELRGKAKANAKISRELSGLEVSQQEADFLQYATDSVATDEFDQLIGLRKETSTSTAPAKTTEQSSLIPEN